MRAFQFHELGLTFYSSDRIRSHAHIRVWMNERQKMEGSIRSPKLIQDTARVQHQTFSVQPTDD